MATVNPPLDGANSSMIEYDYPTSWPLLAAAPYLRKPEPLQTELRNNFDLDSSGSCAGLTAQPSRSKTRSEYRFRGSRVRSNSKHFLAAARAGDKAYCLLPEMPQMYIRAIARLSSASLAAWQLTATKASSLLTTSASSINSQGVLAASFLEGNCGGVDEADSKATPLCPRTNALGCRLELLAPCAISVE